MYFLPKVLKKLRLYSKYQCEIDSTAKICGGSELLDSKVGRYSYLGYNVSLINTEIGKFCSIARNCSIGQYTHPITWVSSSPVFNRRRNILKKNFSEKDFFECPRTVIGNDVWIGENAIIKSGVTIGNGAIVAMGAVVTKNVMPYEIVAGVPAKVIKQRFEDDVICKLQKANWWDWDDTKLKKWGNEFADVKSFLEHIEKENGGKEYNGKVSY